MKKTERIFFLVAAIVLLLLIPFSVFADMGPKPGTTILVENPPAYYYLDLLVEDGEYSYYGNIDDTERALYDPEMLAALTGADIPGWHTALLEGTAAPLFGSLAGSPRDGKMAHKFSYYGVPDTYRIVAVTDDLRIFTSEILHKEIFQETLTVRFMPDGTIEVVERLSKPTVYLSQFVMNLLPTLVVELFILFLFKIPVRRNLLAFFCVNFVTQALLTAVMTRTLMTSGLLNAYFMLAPLEIAVLLLEAAAYFFWMRDVKKSRRIGYAATANLVSAVLGYLWIGFSDSLINVL